MNRIYTHAHRKPHCDSEWITEQVSSSQATEVTANSLLYDYKETENKRDVEVWQRGFKLPQGDTNGPQKDGKQLQRHRKQLQRDT